MTIKFYKTSVDLQVIESIKDKIKKLRPRRIKKLKDIGKPFKIELEDLIIFFFLSVSFNHPFDKRLEEILPELSLNQMEKEKLLKLIGNNKDFQQFVSMKQYFNSEDESIFVQKSLASLIHESLTDEEKKTYNQAVIYLYVRFCPYQPKGMTNE
jgi:hypothetical protein